MPHTSGFIHFFRGISMIQIRSFRLTAIVVTTLLLFWSPLVLAETYSLTTIATFDGTNGASPYAGLVADVDGNLYGTTYGGGANDNGTVFRVAVGSNAATTVATFDGTNGSRPYAGVMLDGSGNLYGTTSQGGSNDQGTVFKVAAGSSTVTTLVTFDGANGANPLSALLADPSGNLYGTTGSLGQTGDGGVIFGGGTVYQVASGTNTLTTLVAFNIQQPPFGNNAVSPDNLIRDASGNLFGTTVLGTSNNGSIFGISAGTNSLTTLATFINSNVDGSYPSGLITDGLGNFYGTTSQGGANNLGTIFKLATSTNTLTALLAFDGVNGANPTAGLVADSFGNLYGTTLLGGASDKGTVFKFVPGTNTVTTIATFDGTNGANPLSTLIFDADGNLYGTTSTGGPARYGTVFKISVPEVPSFFTAFAITGWILIPRRKAS